MNVVKNNNRTFTVSTRYGNLNAAIRTSAPKARQGTELAITTGKDVITFNGREVRALSKMLAKASSISKR